MSSKLDLDICYCTWSELLLLGLWLNKMMMPRAASAIAMNTVPYSPFPFKINVNEHYVSLRWWIVGFWIEWMWGEFVNNNFIINDPGSGIFPLGEYSFNKLYSLSNNSTHLHIHPFIFIQNQHIDPSLISAHIIAWMKA